jgi:hypothetical protein
MNDNAATREPRATTCLQAKIDPDPQPTAKLLSARRTTTRLGTLCRLTDSIGRGSRAMQPDDRDHHEGAPSPFVAWGP